VDPPGDPIAACQFNTVVTAIQSSATRLLELRETPTLDPQVNNPQEPHRNNFAQHPNLPRSARTRNRILSSRSNMLSSLQKDRIFQQVSQKKKRRSILQRFK